MDPLVILISFFFYLVFAFVVGEWGRGKKIGRQNTILISIFLSPVIGFLAALISSKEEEVAERKCNHCTHLIVGETVYCPKCSMDVDGYTRDENRQRFSKQVVN